MLNVEVTRAESAKFHRPLLLVHGLWTGPWIWKRFASYLAHRGWESWTLSPATPRRAFEIATWEAAAEQIGRRFPHAPVMVAHGTAMTLVARLAERLDAPALVTIAPVVTPADSSSLGAVFRRPQFWRARIAGVRVPPPRGRLRAGLVGGAREATLVADDGALFRALARGTLRLPASAARSGLVISAERDPISPPVGGAELAARYGWDHRVYAGRGHLALVEEGWEEIAADAHRWLVRTLGASLLVFLDDEDEAGDQ